MTRLKLTRRADGVVVTEDVFCEDNDMWFGEIDTNVRPFTWKVLRSDDSVVESGSSESQREAIRKIKDVFIDHGATIDGEFRKRL